MNSATGDMLRRIAGVRAAVVPSALRFTPFDFVRGDELGLSAILRWLLDPMGTHGEGSRFLRAFLACHAIPFDEPDLEDVQVQCEAVTFVLGEPRRIDIKLRLANRCIAIENKPWAVWQPRQLWAYWTDISHDPSHGGETHCHVIALRGAVGEIPKEQRAGVPADRLIDTDYVALEALVREFAAGCSLGSVRDFIFDYADHLAREFGYGVPDPMKTALADAVMAEPSLAEAAIDLLAARGEVLARLAAALSSQVRARAEALGIVVASDTLRSAATPAKGAGIALELQPERGLVLALNFETAALGWPYIGLCAASDEQRALLGALPPPPWPSVRYGTDRWFWWQYLKHAPDWPDLHDEAGLLRAMLGGSLADRFLERFVEVRKVLGA